MAHKQARRILVVEEATDFADFIRALLEANGYEVEILSTGRLAVHRLQSSTILPDIILVDLINPAIEGAEVLKLQETDVRFRRIPVIKMKNNGNVEVSTYQLSGDRSFPKSTDIDDLISEISKIFR